MDRSSALLGECGHVPTGQTMWTWYQNELGRTGAASTYALLGSWLGRRLGRIIGRDPAGQDSDPAGQDCVRMHELGACGQQMGVLSADVCTACAPCLPRGARLVSLFYRPGKLVRVPARQTG